MRNPFCFVKPVFMCVCAHVGLWAVCTRAHACMYLCILDECVPNHFFLKSDFGAPGCLVG